MKRRLFVLISAVAAFSLSTTSFAAGQKPLELFGTLLQGTTRDQFRNALKQSGVRPTREDNQYWVDLYDAKGVLEGASVLQVGYVVATNKFAYAEYTFDGFMDTDLVGKIIDKVTSKYGRPTSQTGNYGLGPVSARWSLGQAMQVIVWRNWPDTTTYLKFVDIVANAQMQGEMDAAKKIEDGQKNKAQSNAF